MCVTNFTPACYADYRVGLPAYGYVKEALNTDDPAYGGSGKTFDWSLIGEVNHPYFLAGGLNETNVQRAAQTGAYALDLSSGIETDDVKDMDKMRRVSALVKGANQ